MYFREWKWDDTVVQWVIVKDSGWVDYAETYPWTLAEGQGVKYVGAWFAEGALNVSAEPAVDFINLHQEGSSVGEGQVVQYREHFDADSNVRLILAPSSGDPDLYVWQPGSIGYPDYWSNLPGTVTDTVEFRASVGGTYLIEVHGYSDAVYTLTLETPLVPSAVQDLSVQGSKSLPESPLTATEPGQESPPSPSPRYEIYLPTILKNYP